MSAALTRKLALERVLRTPDGAGGFHQTWQALGTLWAEVLPSTGRPMGQAEIGVSLTRFDIRVRAAAPEVHNRPRPGDRFVEGTRRFLIDTVAEDGGDGRWLICRSREEVAP